VLFCVSVFFDYLFQKLTKTLPQEQNHLLIQHLSLHLFIIFYRIKSDKRISLLSGYLRTFFFLRRSKKATYNTSEKYTQ
jgi:hypothetical protein